MVETRRARRPSVQIAVAVALLASGCASSSEDLGPDDTTAASTSLPSASRPVTAAVRDRLDLVSTPQVLLSFSSDPMGLHVHQRGSAALTASVASLDGGSIALADQDAPDGAHAIQLPPYTGAARYPRAILRVQGAPSALDPGRAEVEWGADVRLDLTSDGRDEDNGDNVLQRGLSSDPDLFKAQLDEDRASCTVRGSQGALSVRSRHRLIPAWWYRVRCLRHDNQLRLTLIETRADGSSHTYRASNSGPIGSIHFADPRIPLGVGGKLTHDGSVFASASDQLNGELANPVVAIHR